MLKIGQQDSFWYPVTVEFVKDGGRRQNYTFQAKFKRLDRDRFVEITDQAANRELKDDELMRDVLLDWKDIDGEDDAPLPFNDETRETLMKLWPVLPAMVQAFFDSHTPGAARKN